MSSTPPATDLLESIDWSATECLNASHQRPLDHALKQVPRWHALTRLDADLWCPFHSSYAHSSIMEQCVYAMFFVLPGVPGVRISMCVSPTGCYVRGMLDLRVPTLHK